MFRSFLRITAILLIFNLFGCKNENSNVTGEPLPPSSSDDKSTVVTGGTGNINFISKEKILLNDNSEIALPKDGDTSSIVFYFAPPAENAEGKSALSENGLFRSQILTTVMAKAGLAMVYAEGNSALQTVTQLARANYSELNIFTAEQADATLKSLAKDYKGKKVMVCASAPVLTQMIGQLTGKPAPTLPAGPTNDIFVIIAKGIGNGEMKTIKF